MSGTSRHRRAVCGWLCSLALLSAMGCGGSSPSGPSATTIDLVGSWAGTWTFTSAGATVTDTVTMTVTQSGTSAVGLWAAGSGTAGRVTFTAGSTVAGTTTISQTLLNGQNCSTSTSVTGTASTSRVQFTLGPLATAGLCQWATNQQITVTR